MLRCSGKLPGIAAGADPPKHTEKNVSRATSARPQNAACQRRGADTGRPQAEEEEGPALPSAPAAPGLRTGTKFPFLPGNCKWESRGFSERRALARSLTRGPGVRHAGRPQHLRGPRSTPPLLLSRLRRGAGIISNEQPELVLVLREGRAGWGCRLPSREPTLPRWPSDRVFAASRSAEGMSGAPGMAPSRPLVAFPVPLQLGHPAAFAATSKRRKFVGALCEVTQRCRRRCARRRPTRGTEALEGRFRNSVRHTGCLAGVPCVTLPTINLSNCFFAERGRDSSLGSAAEPVSPSGNRRGVCMPRKAPAGQMVAGSPTVVAPPRRGLAVASALVPRSTVPA